MAPCCPVGLSGNAVGFPRIPLKAPARDPRSPADPQGPADFAVGLDGKRGAKRFLCACLEGPPRHVPEVDAWLQQGCPRPPLQAGLYCADHDAVAEDTWANWYPDSFPGPHFSSAGGGFWGSSRAFQLHACTVTVGQNTTIFKENRKPCVACPLAPGSARSARRGWPHPQAQGYRRRRDRISSWAAVGGRRRHVAGMVEDR